MESASQVENKSEKCKIQMKPKPKFDIQTLPGGKFNLKITRKSACKVNSEIENKHTSDSFGISNLLGECSMGKICRKTRISTIFQY